jgi:hypothetical protein
MNFDSTTLSGSRPSRPDQERRQNVPARFTQLRWFWRIWTILRLMPSIKIPTTTGHLQEGTSHNRLVKIISNDRRINPGDKTARVTTPIGTA